MRGFPRLGVSFGRRGGIPVAVVLVTLLAVPVKAANPEAAGTQQPGAAVSASGGKSTIQGTAAPGAEEGVPGGLGKMRRVEELGIEVVAIRLTAAGYMLDFRFKVLSPEKAQPLFDRKIKPYLIDQVSGARMAVPVTPKAGSLRQTPRSSTAGQVYFTIFANPGQFIKAGNKVTVVYEKQRIEDIVVE